MNLQRKQIYSKRRNALIGDKLSLDLFNSFAETIYELLNDYNDSRDYKNFSNDKKALLYKFKILALVRIYFSCNWGIYPG